MVANFPLHVNLKKIRASNAAVSFVNYLANLKAIVTLINTANIQ